METDFIRIGKVMLHQGFLTIDQIYILVYHQDKSHYSQLLDKHDIFMEIHNHDKYFVHQTSNGPEKYKIKTEEFIEFLQTFKLSRHCHLPAS